MRVNVYLVCAICSACAAAPEAVTADLVLDAPGASGAGFGDPTRAVNGVRGGGADAQSLDVYAIPPDSHLVLGWEGRRVLDGPGADLVVFENPFDYGDGLRFMDPAIVEVSVDGVGFVAFPHDYLGPDERVYAARPAAWIGFAGVTPVHRNEDAAAPIDAFDPGAGGDAFDLADLPPGALPGLRERGICCVRMSAASAWTNPDSDAPYPRDPVSDGVDIDGVVARYLDGAP